MAFKDNGKAIQTFLLGWDTIMSVDVNDLDFVYAGILAK
jgi:hypothetical protein